MGHYALIGKRLGHSWSQVWFEGLFARLGLTDCSYGLCEMADLTELRRWVKDNAVDGFNVTVPYKQHILPLLDDLDEEAVEVGAVNCVTVVDGRLVGHNTDSRAFGESLARWMASTDGPHARPMQALVLGTGGAAHAVAHALDRLAIPLLMVSRQPEDCTTARSVIAYDDLDAPLVQRSRLIINATPVGMHPDSDRSPWPASAPLDGRHRVYDLVYNPSPTLFMRQAAAQGALTKDGLEMLERQAEYSWQLFSGN